MCTAPTSQSWKSSEVEQRFANATTNDLVAPLFLVCGVGAGATTLRVGTTREDADIGELTIRVTAT